QEIWGTEARCRRLSNLHRMEKPSMRARPADRRNSDDLNGKVGLRETLGNNLRRGVGRTDSAIASYLGIGGKDLYRQARAIWKQAQAGDSRARCAVAQLDAGTKTIHAAYKDLRRRNSFSVDFRPTPYDVWSFRHNHAFGIPYPGSIPAAIVAHTLHYYT